MTHTKAQAQVEIAKLVNTFAVSEARLQNEVEAQIENNFIRPLFEYLNWNTHNIGLSGTEYEFLVQKTDRYGKLPDYILQLVAAMLELHKRHAAATTQTDQELYQRQLDATDRQIDALVYELYDLTPEEIAIVEGGGK